MTSPPSPLHIVKDGDERPQEVRTQPEVIVDANEARVAKQAIMAMHKRGGVYQRGGKMVEPRLIPAPKRKSADALIRESDSWQFTEVRTPRARALAAESCFFTKFNKKQQKVAANVPEWLAGSVLSQIDWPFPVLKGLAEAPTMRPDGSIISTPGYDEDTGIYLAPNNIELSMPNNPSQEDARAAAELLLDVICDFPFSSGAGRSVWLSGVLSCAARAAIDGPVPMHIMDASMRGSGKSRLVDAATRITSGRDAPRMAYAESDEEMDKRISALAIAGDETALIDNVVGDFGCPSLDAALTSTSYRGRILGKTEMTPALPMRIVWWVTGNGMTLGADLARRSILGRIEPQCEHPEEREGPRPGEKWRHHPLLDYVKANRSRLLSAALTIMKGYIDAGKPKQAIKSMDFEAWSETVRSAIVWAGLADPGSTIYDVRKADAKADAFKAFVDAWPIIEGKSTSAAELVEYALGNKAIPVNPESTIADALDPTKPDVAKNAWKTALTEWCPPNRGDADVPSPLSLGNRLRRMKGAIIGDFRLDAGERNEFGVTWIKTRIRHSTPVPPPIK